MIADTICTTKLSSPGNYNSEMSVVLTTAPFM